MPASATVIGERYELRNVVGRGGMGRVWLAYDRSLRREVAVKEFITPPGSGDPQRARLRELALREARTAARVTHPNTIRILDMVEAQQRPWIVMEFVASSSLRELVVRNGPLPPAYVATVGIALLDALTATHRAGVLHRDVKPDNVLIGHDGRVVLTDFGIAVWADHDQTQTEEPLGTPQYVAPERVSTNLSLPEGDLWSLGATLYMAVEGRGPYTRDCVEDTFNALLTRPPDRPRHAAELAPVLRGLLHPWPQQRLPAAKARRELTRVAGHAHPDPEPHWSVRTDQGRPAPRRSSVAPTIAVAATAVMMAARCWRGAAGDRLEAGPKALVDGWSRA